MSETRWDVEECRLECRKAKALDDERVLDANTTLERSERGKEEKQPRLRVLECLDALLTLPNLRLNAILVDLDTLHSKEALLRGEEPRRSRVVREEKEEKDEGDESEERGCDHEPLPLVRGRVRVGVEDAEGEEAGDDDGDAVALECPAKPFTDLGARVEHGAYEHEPGGHCAFGGAEEKADCDWGKECTC